MQIHHIGYLVKKINKAITSFEGLGYVLEAEPVFDEGRQAEICFLTNGGYRVELVSPLRDSDLFPLIKKYGDSPYHICYSCEDLEAAIAELKKDKFLLFKQPSAAPAISSNARVAFLMKSNMGMVELVEVK